MSVLGRRIVRTAQTTNERESIVVQGFVEGGGVESPYVYVGLRDEKGLTFVAMLSTAQANELGEILRQEAEAAAGGKKGDI